MLWRWSKASHLPSPSTNLTRGLATRRLFSEPPCRKGTIHLQTSMPSLGFEPNPNGIAVSATNHYTRRPVELETLNESFSTNCLTGLIHRRRQTLVFKAGSYEALSLKEKRNLLNRLAFDGPADSWGNRLRALTARCFALSHSVFLARSLGQWWFGFTFIHIDSRGTCPALKLTRLRHEEPLHQKVPPRVPIQFQLEAFCKKSLHIELL
ncbi:hypothetical protein TNCV_4099201 [Trichonephila clavipes]|nr:hypothetical protein TNCV_4099201 [Trichonephila clavipes]